MAGGKAAGCIPGPESIETAPMRSRKLRCFAVSMRKSHIGCCRLKGTNRATGRPVSGALRGRRGPRQGESMAADPLKTLAALNRFGLGARPGDAAKAAADPRGFVRDQIVRPVAALDASLPAGDAALRAMRMVELGREAERTRVASLAPAAQPANGMASGMAGGMAGGMADGGGMAGGMSGGMSGCTRRDGGSHAGAGEAASAAAEVALFRAEVAARFARLATTENGLVERLAMFWSNHFAVSVAKGNTLRVARRAVRARGDPPARARPLRRHAARRRDASGDAGLSRQQPVDRAAARAPGATASAASTRTSPAKSWSCTRWASTAATRRPTSPASPASSPAGRVSAPDEDHLHGGRFTFAPARHEPGRPDRAGRGSTRTTGWSRAARRWTISRAIPPRRGTSPASSPAISSPTSRRRRSWIGWPRPSATPRAISTP